MKERAKRAGGSGKKKVFEREFTDLATITNISSTVVDSLRIAQRTKSEREQSGILYILCCSLPSGGGGGRASP